MNATPFFKAHTDRLTSIPIQPYSEFLVFTLFVSAFLLTPFQASANTEILLTVTIPTPSNRTVPGLAEVTARVADELNTRGFKVKLSSSLPDIPRLNDFSQFESDAANRDVALGVAVFLPESTMSQSTWLVVIDRVTGKTLKRSLPPTGEPLLSSTVALAVGELVEASLVELYLPHETMKGDVEKPKDLPLPKLPMAKSGKIWTAEFHIGLLWPTLLKAVAGSVALSLGMELSPRWLLAVEVKGTPMGFKEENSAGVVRSFPLETDLVLGFDLLSEKDRWDLMLQALAGPGILVMDSKPQPGYRTGVSYAPFVTVAGGIAVRRYLSDFYLSGEIRVHIPVLFPEVEAGGELVQSFGRVWPAGGLGAGWRF